MTPEAMQARLREGLPLADAWAVEVLGCEAGNALLRLPPRDLLLRPGGTVSGPALMGLSDMAMWVALLSMTEGRDESRTINLAIHFLRPTPAGAVLAEARILRRGRTLSYGDVLLRAEGATNPCAHVTSSWANVPPG
jgi:uncharacterized protein (TIGR00369 family)